MTALCWHCPKQSTKRAAQGCAAVAWYTVHYNSETAFLP